jgi:curved DNA-binding protein CbpA
MDYYQVLGIHKDSSEVEIKKAYRTLALKFHPDKNGGSDAPERFKLISEAYQVLGDSQKRRVYDNNRNPSAAGGFQEAEDVFRAFFQNDPFFSPSRRTGEQNHHFGMHQDPFFNMFHADMSPFNLSQRHHSMSEQGIYKLKLALHSSFTSRSFRDIGDNWSGSVSSKSQKTIIRNGQRETVTTTNHNGQTTIEREIHDKDGNITREKTINVNRIEDHTSRSRVNRLADEPLT